MAMMRRLEQLNNLLLLLLLCCLASHKHATAQSSSSSLEVEPLGGVVSIRRSLSTQLLPKVCNFSGTVVFAGPSSLEQGDKYYFPSYRQRLGYQLVLDYVNRHRCGASIGDKNFKIDLQTYDDQSSTTLTESIAHMLVQAPYSNQTAGTTSQEAVDLIVAGYSSGLTKPLSTVVAEYNLNVTNSTTNTGSNHQPRLLMCAGSALTSNFANRPHIFTTAPPVAKFIQPAIEALATQTTARTVATVWEDNVFASAACASAPDLAAQYGLDLIAQVEVSETPNSTVLEPVARQFANSNPDVVITCVYDCIPWHSALRHVHWSPKAQVYTICIKDEDYKGQFGTDVEYMMGVVNWDESVTATDALTGWTSQEFARRFAALSSDTVVVSAATLGAAMMSVIVQAMEATDTVTNATTLSNHLSTHHYETMMGNVSFDENGQSALSLVLVQYDPTGVVQSTFPLSVASRQIVYPMPTWDGRDCVHLSNCQRIDNHTCSYDGHCECPQDTPENFISTGFGATARCVPNAYVVVQAAAADTWASPGVILGLVAACLVAVGILTWAVMEQKKRKNDAVWKVNKEEIKFEDPPVVVGRGTFGVVLLGEYRGTEVAVKRVIPSKKQMDDSRKYGSGSGVQESAVYSKGLASGTASTSMTMKPNGSMSLSMSGRDSSGGGGGGGGFTLGLQNTEKVERRRLERDFISEMRYLSKLRHPCITTVMGAVIKKGEDPMLVMEYMFHGSLYDILHNNTMVLEGEILLPIMRDISSGLRFLHASNPQIIHGDLKAANILVDSKFRAKVADFGLSQKHKLGAAAGTPFWMAPELLRGTSVNTAASDMYAYGIILYEVFSRKDPYDGEDPREVVKLVADPKVNKRPPVPRNCPPLVESLMTDCLVEDPQERPTFEEVNVRLKRMDASKVETGASKDHATISLFDIFPRHIAEALRDGREVEPEHKDCVTIFFSDIVGFTNISATLEPRKVALMLDRLYTKFDGLSDKHELYKVETIGDAYMAVTNLVKDQPHDHAKRVALFAVDAIQAANETQIDLDDPSKGFVNIRVGFHSGPVVADVVGSRNPRYCLFGDTVNTASRMESTSKVNSIHCSEAAHKLLKEQDPAIPTKSRGVIEVKGKGKQLTFWVNEGRGSIIGKPAPAEFQPTESIKRRETLQPLIEVSEDFTSQLLDVSDDLQSRELGRRKSRVSQAQPSPWTQPPAEPDIEAPSESVGLIEKAKNILRLDDEIWEDEISL